MTGCPRTARTIPSSAASWREVEVELAGGDNDLLAAVDTVLREHGLTVSARSAKLERVLSSQLPPPAREPRATAAGPAYRVITSYLAAQAEELAALDPMVRRFRPDSVHQMRIATRRLRSTLRTFGAVISDAASEHVAAELKWLGDVLGRERDNEVLAAHLRAQREQTDAAQLLRPGGGADRRPFRAVGRDRADGGAQGPELASLHRLAHRAGRADRGSAARPGR